MGFPHSHVDMENWNSIICSLVGALAYMANSLLLPNWSHALVGIFTGLIFIAVYWLIGNQSKIWFRVSISVAVAIAVATLVRILWL